jgi:site-specific recombinase XerD
MSSVDTYINAATRDNTRRSYRSAIEHFEATWGGFLPATADSVARYLADYANTLSISTLRQRLAAIAQWHIDQGFPDPTKAPMVKKVLKGIRTVHPAQEKQAKPLALTQLEQVDQWLEEQIKQADMAGDSATQLKATRDRAIILLGFWRGFRSDELSLLEVQHITVMPSEGMSVYLPKTKTQQGVTFGAPVLSRLCPVNAYLQWIALAGLTEGPVFRGINRWGQLNEAALNPTSFIRILRSVLQDAGIADSEEYSSHSLRRGLATWANANGWSIKSLMEYVGWKDVNSAMRYIDIPDPYRKSGIEQGLKQLQPIAAPAVI